MPAEPLVAPRRQRWQTIAARIAGCTACSELATTRRHVVVGTAPPGARLALIGEAPGAAEDERGEPFVGRSGQLLDQLLAGAGLDRSGVAVVNVLKCRPPGNRKPVRAEIARCRPFLDQQLDVVDPAVVCLLGGTAVAAFFGPAARIAPLRGRAHELGDRRLVATYHPSAAIRFGSNGAPLAALREDLALVATLLRARDLP